MDLYFKEIDLVYIELDEYFREKVLRELSLKSKNKEDLKDFLKESLELIKQELLDLGFQEYNISSKFSSTSLDLDIYEYVDAFDTKEKLFKTKLAPLIHELVLRKVLRYLVGLDHLEILVKLREKNLIPIEFLAELKEYKKNTQKEFEKIDNLRNYIQIKSQIVEEFKNNKDRVESLEELQETRSQLQLLYIIYRILDFFNFDYVFDFSNIQMYLKEHKEDWLLSLPLVSLRNPDLYFCGIYLANHLDFEIDKQEILDFLKRLIKEIVDEYNSPIMEATSQVYYVVKSYNMLEKEIPDQQKDELLKEEENYFTTEYLKDQETSDLIVILKIYKMLNEFDALDEQKVKSIEEEIDERRTEDGVKQQRDMFVTSESDYYIVFYYYMMHKLDELEDYNILESICPRIYRNLELLDFSKEANYDLFSEIFYSCETLKLLNCIDSKFILLELAKYLFPEEVGKLIKETEEIDFEESKFLKISINRNTGETIY